MVENLGPAPAEVSLLFTFQNGTGAPQDKAGGHYNRPFVVLPEEGGAKPSVVGVQLHHAQAVGARASHGTARSSRGGMDGQGGLPSTSSPPSKVKSMHMQRSGGPPEEQKPHASQGALDAAVSSLAASLCNCGESCQAAALEIGGGAVEGVCRNCGLDVDKAAVPVAEEAGAGRKGTGRDDGGPPAPLPLTFAIACPVVESVEASVWNQFRTSMPPNGGGSEPGARELWAQFAEEGSLRDPALNPAAAGTGWWASEKAAAMTGGPTGATVVERRADLPERRSRPKEAVAGAVCQKTTVPGHGRCSLTFALAWDMPYAVFGQGLALPRRYTRFFPGSLRGHHRAAAGTIKGQQEPPPSTSGGSSVAGLLVAHALARYPTWEEAIEAWQRPVLEDDSLPVFYRHMLFNELYYLTDGGTVWTDSAGGESLEGRRHRDTHADDANAAFRDCHGEQRLVGQFLYLEGHEYLMYNTYDVHFYASFALAMLWPMLELSLQQDVAAAVMAEDPRTRRLIARGELRPRKVHGSVPHDLGCPSGEPWREVNAYNLQDVNRWKDLGPKLVLQVQRDFAATRSRPFLERLWPVLVHVMQAAQAYDRDGDGLIENENFPDQTYDIWTVEGPSAYTGGLWVAALTAMAAVGDALGDAAHASRYRAQAARARAAYAERLWNGRYFDYDASESVHQDSIMADQMAGQWYARACGLPPGTLCVWFLFYVPVRASPASALVAPGSLPCHHHTHLDSGGGGAGPIEPRHGVRVQRAEVRGRAVGRGERDAPRRERGRDVHAVAGGVDGHHLLRCRRHAPGGALRGGRGPPPARRPRAGAARGGGLPAARRLRDGARALRGGLAAPGVLVRDARGLERAGPLPLAGLHAAPLRMGDAVGPDPHGRGGGHCRGN